VGNVDAADIYYTSTDIISNSGRVDIYALFAQLKYRLNRTWTLSAGLRFDFSRFHDAAFSIDEPSYSIIYFTDFQFDNIPTRHWNSINPKFIIQYSPSQKSRFYFTLAKGFRAPLLDDLCRSERSDRGMRIANPKLNPEHIYNLELGLDKKLFDKVTFELSSYYTVGYDFMQMLSTGDSVNIGYAIVPIYQISNISMVIIKGLESDISFILSKNSGVRINYTFNSASIRRFTPNSKADIDLTGKYLPNIPAHRFSFEGHCKNKIFNFSAKAEFQGKRYIKDDNTIDNIYLLTDMYPSAITVNTKFWKEFRAFVFSFEIDNLFNEIYINSKGYKSPGRMLFAKISYNFIINNNEKKKTF
jgi:iron complex outermembrane receptor protein